MKELTLEPQTALKAIFVIEEVVEELTDSFNDLLIASQSSLDFWDNPFDDEDWNDV